MNHANYGSRVLKTWTIRRNGLAYFAPPCVRAKSLLGYNNVCVFIFNVTYLMCVDRYMPPGKSLSINSSSAINILHYIVQSSLFTTVDHGRIYLHDVYGIYRRRQSDATTSLVLRHPVHAIALFAFLRRDWPVCRGTANPQY